MIFVWPEGVITVVGSACHLILSWKKMNLFNIIILRLSKIRLNVSVPSTSRSFKWSYHFRLSDWMVCLREDKTDYEFKQYAGFCILTSPVSFSITAVWTSTDYVHGNQTFFFLLALRPPLGVVFYGPLVGFSLLAYEVSWSHSTTRHSRSDSSERMISPSQRPLPDNTQHSQQTNIHAPSGIRTRNLSRRAAKDLRLRPRGHWDRQL